MRFRHNPGRIGFIALAVASAVSLAACDKVKNSLLEAIDPDVIDPSSVQSANGATAVRNGALARLRTATADGESTWLFGGLLVDEYATSSTFVQNDETDQRSIQLNNSIVNSMLRQVYRVRLAANQAIDLLNQYKPSPDEDIGEMYFARGFAELQLASDFCNGIPLSDGRTGEKGIPLTVDSVFKVAVASFDTAIIHSGGASPSGANAKLINQAARIAKARALLAISLSNATAAADLVKGIPNTFRYDVTASVTSGNNNILWSQPISSNRYIIGDSIQKNDRSITVKNAIPFFSAHDPRVPAHYKISKGDTVKAQDGGTFVIEADTLFGQTSPVALVSGIDARLIEAEAALAAGDAPGMMTILNALRASPQVLTPSSPTSTGTHPGLTTPVMAPLADPGTKVGRENLLFREKAFWTFSRGQRLGDLRRLIREYGRAADGSDTGGYPMGDHFKGGVFGVDLNLPVTQSEQTDNPNFEQCLDRKA
jgi:hypothetical protein